MDEQKVGIICYLGLGANLGQPKEQCIQAAAHIGAVEGIEVLRCSSMYRTEPVGDSSQEWFVNAALEIKTSLSPAQLLEVLLSIERKMGRQRSVRWAPRIIDIDILFYGQQAIRQADMIIPHPELHRRRFVLVPLHEIAPYLTHPALGVSLKQLIDGLDDNYKVELIV